MVAGGRLGGAVEPVADRGAPGAPPGPAGRAGPPAGGAPGAPVAGAGFLAGYLYVAMMVMTIKTITQALDYIMISLGYPDHCY